MFNKEKKFVFVHNPKCAGTSIKNAISEHLGLDENQHNNENRFYRNPHLTLNQYNYYIDDDLNDYFKFISTRNPWDRMVSLHHHRVLNANHKRPFGLMCRVGQLKYLTFSNLASINGEICIDFVIKFENLQEDFDKAMKKIGVNNPPKLKKFDHGNNRRKDYRSCYTKETKEMIGDMFAEEIKRFNYKF